MSTDPIVQLSRALALAGGVLEDLTADQRLPALRVALELASVTQEQLVVMLLGAAIIENARTELGAWP